MGILDSLWPLSCQSTVQEASQKGLNNEIPQMPRFQSKITLHIKNQEDLKLTLEKIASGQDDRDVIGQFKAAIAIESLSKEIKG